MKRAEPPVREPTRRRRKSSACGPLDEIIVTAEKREESLQRSALAVTALASPRVERQQITDLKSVTTLIPNLQIGLSVDAGGLRSGAARHRVDEPHRVR